MALWQLCRKAPRLTPACDCFSGSIRAIKIAIRVIFVVVNNIYCIPAYVAWVLTLRPLRSPFPDLYWKLEGLLFHWLLAMVSMWSWTAGYEIAESGDDISICMNERTLVIANHQSTADVPMLMAAWNNRPGLLPNLMWIMDRLFKFTNFGIVSVMHEDFFIQSGRQYREASLQALRRHLRDTYVPRSRKFLVLFPEGGFLRKRIEASQRFAAKNNLPLLEKVSLPRAGALKVIMEELGPQAGSKVNHASTGLVNNEETCVVNNSSSNAVSSHSGLRTSDRLRWVLDVTVAYSTPGAPLDLPSIVSGATPPSTTHLHYRLYPSTDVPLDPEAQTQWLYERFFEKEKMLEVFYETGRFPPNESRIPCQSQHSQDSAICNNEPRLVRHDALRYFILHLFFITSTFIYYQIFRIVYHFFQSTVLW